MRTLPTYVQEHPKAIAKRAWLTFDLVTPFARRAPDDRAYGALAKPAHLVLRHGLGYWSEAALSILE